jgi:hypothetical protein
MSTFTSGAAPNKGLSYSRRINSDDESEDDLTHFGGFRQNYQDNLAAMDFNLTADATDPPVTSHNAFKRLRSPNAGFEDGAVKKKSANDEDDDDSDSADSSALLSSYRSDTDVPLTAESFKQLKEDYLPLLLDLDSKLLRREVKVESEETLINSVGHRVKPKLDYLSYFDQAIFKNLRDDGGLLSDQFVLAYTNYQSTLLTLFKKATIAEIHEIKARIVSIFDKFKEAALALIPTDQGADRDAMKAAYNKLFREVKLAREENKEEFIRLRRKQGGGPPAARTAAIVATQTTTGTSKAQPPNQQTTAAQQTNAAPATTANNEPAKPAATPKIATAPSNSSVTNQEPVTVIPAELDALVEAKVKRALATRNSTPAGPERKNPLPKNKQGPQQQPPPKKPPHQPEQGTARGTATVLAGGPDANKNGSHGNPNNSKKKKNQQHRNPNKEQGK